MRRYLAVRRASQPERSSGGFTLIEVLVASLLSAMIVASVGAALIMTMRNVGQTNERLTSSKSALQTNARFAEDIANASVDDGSNAIGRGKPGCGGDATSVLRTVVAEGGVVRVVSYSIPLSATTLERRTCQGGTLVLALAAPSRASGVVRDLGTGLNPVSVICRDTPISSPSPVNDTGDSKCNLVTMTVRTKTGYVFSVDGQRDTTLGHDAPPPETTLKQCTLTSSADASVSSYSSYSNKGRELYLGTFQRQGQISGNGKVISYFKVDLLGPCTGANEPDYLPGGKRLLSADLRLFLLKNSSPDNAGYESTHRIRVVDATWDEMDITWNEQPFPKAAGPQHNFQAGRPFSGQKAFHFDVLTETRQWYIGPSAGGWVNFGWLLDRGDGNWGDTGNDDGFHWGSRETGPAASPTLTVTWQ